MLEVCSQALWSALLPVLLGTGVWLTIKTKGFALRNIGRAVGWTFSSGSQSGASPFACLCTALATTVGTGNIAGVAVALTAGGPGALVWMWISAAVGCAVKYAECALAVQFRLRTDDGGWLGGSMVTLARGLRRRWLGAVYAALALVFSLTAANLVQSSAIAVSFRQLGGVPAWMSAVIVGLLTLLVVSGGAKSVAKCSTALVPVMTGLYVLGGAAVLIYHADAVPGALKTLLCGAFSLRSAGAGAFGHMVRTGVTRGCFSNDSGTGSAAFSAALTSTDAVRQGLISATANLWDTGLICSVTGLTILVSGAMNSGLTGVPLAMAAFCSALGGAGRWLVGGCLILFAFSTLPGLAFQGEQALRFLWDSQRVRRLYRAAFCLIAALGCTMSVEPALVMADLGNGLLAAVNLVALWRIDAPGENALK